MSILYEHLSQKCHEWQDKLDDMRREARSAWQPDKDLLHAEADGFSDMLFEIKKVLREYKPEGIQ